MAKQIATYGRLRLHYRHGTNPHTTSVALTSALAPNNIVGCQSAADDLAGALANICASSVTFDSWDSLDPFGAVVGSAGITGLVVGLHAGGGNDWESLTLKFTGKEIIEGPDGRRGNTDLEVFTGHSYQPNAGVKNLSVSADIDLGVVASFLATDMRIWAGFHGNKATVRDSVPVQFNAHAQRTVGS